jgi:hypothetical protein
VERVEKLKSERVEEYLSWRVDLLLLRGAEAQTHRALLNIIFVSGTIIQSRTTGASAQTAHESSGLTIVSPASSSSTSCG